MMSVRWTDDPDRDPEAMIPPLSTRLVFTNLADDARETSPTWAEVRHAIAWVVCLMVVLYLAIWVAVAIGGHR